jgi:hypothetical protein
MELLGAFGNNVAEVIDGWPGYVNGIFTMVAPNCLAVLRLFAPFCGLLIYEHSLSNRRLRRHCAGPAPNAGAGNRRGRPGVEK